MSRLNNIDNERVKDYIYSISSKLMRHFDLEYQKDIEDEYFDLYAFHRNDFFKSFLTRSTVYEGYSIFEHILVKYIPECKNEDADSFRDMLIRFSPILSNPNKFHKRSIITGIIITDSVSDTNYLKFINKFYYRKSYKYLFHGWSETTMALVSMADDNIYLPKVRKKEISNLLKI